MPCPGFPSCTIEGLAGKVVSLLGAVAKILRYPPAELAGRDVKALFHPDDTVAMGASYQGTHRR
jgi:hypothetical protein